MSDTSAERKSCVSHSEDAAAAHHSHKSEIDKIHPESEEQHHFEDESVSYAFVRRFGASACGSAVAELCTLPTDVIKTRLQLQKSVAHSRVRLATHSGDEVYKGMLDAGVSIFKHEGVGGLYKGLNMALLRQVSYTGLAFMIFEPIRNQLTALSGAENNEAGFFTRVLAGGSAGAIGITVFNPVEVVKIQMQASQQQKLRFRPIVRNVYKSEGILGFWAGLPPNIARAFLINAAEIGSYDHVKHELLDRGIVKSDGIMCRLLSSFSAGTLSAVVSTPVDVVKTRLMDQAGHSHEYKGTANALWQIPQREGFAALYKGFVPIIFRKVMWTCSFFLTYEHGREMFGLPPS